MADAGRIVIIPKGEYKSNITYERLDAVEYNNNGYIALKTVTGITPTNDGTNWALYVKGTQVDSELSTTSTNAVQNKIVTAEISALKKENTNQSTEMLDIKMLGWSVPRECPIQNEVSGNQFVQKVGRVDIGTLYITKLSDATRNLYSCSVPNIKPESSRDTAINGYCYGWTAVSRSTSWKDGMFSYHSNSTVCFTTNTYTDVNSFKTAMQGQYLYYELANYITKTIDGNEVVASLLKRIQALESQFASETSKLCSDAIDDLASVVSTQDEAIDELATIVTESEEK